MSDKIKKSYKQSKNIYDDAITQGKWWSRLYSRLFWSGVDDKEIAQKVLNYIPDDFSGKLLDVPVGTAVFTCDKYTSLKNAEITCLDYSEDMLEQANTKFRRAKISNITAIQGDVGALPFSDKSFDIVLSMNGFHAFPDKDKAYAETGRVLKQGGKFISCFYVQGKSRITDILVKWILAKRGWFTPLFDTVSSLKERIEKVYKIKKFHVKGSMVWFCAVKK